MPLPEPTDVYVYFNMRSPYCYLASKTLFDLVDAFHVRLLWRPLGGYHGRSEPGRAKVKMPIARQDVARFARRMGIPCKPPPPTTEPTLAGVGSLLAEKRGVLRAYVVETMRAEWAYGQDIGQEQVLLEVAREVGLDPTEFRAYIQDGANHEPLERYWTEAQEKGVFGVPTFVVHNEVFWGNDRLDFVREHLAELRLARM